MTVKGWLLDAYPSEDKMVFWVKQENGKTIRLESSWTPSIYVATDNKSDFSAILHDPELPSMVRAHEVVSRYERVIDREESKVLRLELSKSSVATRLAERIELLGPFGKFRLYNVDLLPAQSYLYEHELFPLAYCEVNPSSPVLKWDVLDDVWSTDYTVPDLKILNLDVSLRKEAKLPRFSDKVASITLAGKDGKKIMVEAKSEIEIFQALEREIARIDPDFILVQDGDSFVFPYLIHRAAENGVSLSLSRESTRLRKPKKEGTSYFSYGRIQFKPTAVKLRGRIHIDTRNSFTLDETGLHGLYEIARICRMPLHTASRASIGKCLSSLQFYHAHKKGLLVPWKPVLVEHFKTYGELLVADRGGFLFEPRTGVYEQAAEFDFASLYPSIMFQKNVSAETVRCPCCPDSKERVPELGYNICEKRRGIVPQALKIVIKKRAMYKELKKNATDDIQKAIYDERQSVLKWINVTSFGYLGFNNAKFGRIDAHIAVCAFDRQLFLQATRIAERMGFRVLHGIVDSLWLQKQNATMDDYAALKEAIECETGFSISFEGVYKWIVFFQSKESDELPAANRYFGAFQDGSLKIRGIEARRHDTPPLFVKFQHHILKIMARGDSIADVRLLMTEVRQVFDDYAAAIRDGRVSADDLVFTKQLSKDAGQYQERNTIENNSMSQLAREGKSLKAGQILRYVITDYYRDRHTTPEEFLDEKTQIDSKKYVEILAEMCNSVTEPFGLRIKPDDDKGGHHQLQL
ncbi:DNA polymerase elongation subunit (family B) [Candidatus Nitrososphaera evergladensis SR1]|uniref:DNA-directed DNA polymerase n=1 Tax=Candidatus Nitrososphaera evergladensis SR1 TaxID=1459636 RepID=A0A075MKX0_9ARCH|nr:DNA polymerase domain-containing protein [Candidatus Nitrososphaera evergladensis]AIF82091.1 DNA polymerase elongation subunit (family B) [Candidatus Nitrososphaera evergladensis SR1]